MDRFKQQLLSVIDFRQEMDLLLGKGKNTTRKCPFHQDKSPSLSYSPDHGGWKCHGCGERGDLFTLYQKLNKVGFGEAYKHYLKKYNIWQSAVDFKKSKFVEKHNKRFKTLPRTHPVLTTISADVAAWDTGRRLKKGRLAFMVARYGINLDTLRYWKISVSSSSGRLEIPIPAEKIWVAKQGGGKQHSPNKWPAIVNVRRHDAFRVRCQWYNEETGEILKRGRPSEVTDEDIIRGKTDPWRPIYGDKTGKTTSLKGHGACYVYPMEVLEENNELYLVGGELKAILLWQLGLPAITFTTGEGSISEEWLPYLIGKRVRILFDADPEKDFKKDANGDMEPLLATYNERQNATARKAFDFAQILANAGAIVELFIWPKAIAEQLPRGGDITDLLRLTGWQKETMTMLDGLTMEKNGGGWVEVPRQLTAEELKKLEVASQPKNIVSKESEPSWDETDKAPFPQLVEPSRLRTWVRVRGQVSGQGNAPFAIPTGVKATCKSGEADIRPKCAKCGLRKRMWRANLKFDMPTQLTMVGKSDEAIDKQILTELGVPRNCHEPEIEYTPAAIQSVILTPPLDVEEDDDGSAITQNFEHRQAYLVGESLIKIEDNVSYDFKGRIMADPQRGKFTLAATEWRPVKDDIFHWQRSAKLDQQLRAATKNLISDLRDNIVQQIWGQDTMLEIIMLSYFMPMSFKVGGQTQERLCPSIMILGDTNVGKSTATAKIMAHYGTGRLYAAGSDATFAGIIGGVARHMDQRSTFHWGALPAAHRRLFAFDEFNHLPLETIGKLTNVISSGIAERITNMGVWRTLAHVRMLYLCNPRSTRRLTTYRNPLDAAREVVGTVQDLGRVDLVWVQYQLDDVAKYSFIPKAEDMAPALYTREVGRYHLSWFWSRTPNQIRFEDAAYIFDRSIEIAKRFGSHALFLPAQARFKLARLACAYAALNYSTGPSGDTVLVKQEHVEQAVDLLERCYGDYINPHLSSQGIAIPEPLVELLDKIPDSSYRRLRFLTRGTSFSTEDINDAIGTRLGGELLNMLRFDFALVTRKRSYFQPHPSDKLADMIDQYLVNRDRNA